MLTQIDMEAAVCEGASRVRQEVMGRCSQAIDAKFVGELLLVRFFGVLTDAEQRLAAVPSENGRDLLKQVRTQLIEIARPQLDAMIEGITGVKPVSLHHDISTRTAEEIVVFVLAAAPQFGESGS